MKKNIQYVKLKIIGTLLILPVIFFVISSFISPVNQESIGPVTVEYPKELTVDEQKNLDKYLLDISYIDANLLQLPEKIVFVDETIDEILGEDENLSFIPMGMTEVDSKTITITLETYGADIVLHELMHLVNEKVGEMQGEKPSDSQEFLAFCEQYGEALQLTSYENSMPEEQFVGIMLRIVNTPGMVQEVSPELYAWGNAVLQSIQK